MRVITERAMTIPDISSMSRYVSPINPAVFPHLSVVLLGIGLFFTAWFFVYEVSRSQDSQDVCMCNYLLFRSHPANSPESSTKSSSSLLLPQFSWDSERCSSCSGWESMCEVLSFIRITKCECELFNVHHPNVHFYCLSMWFWNKNIQPFLSSLFYLQELPSYHHDKVMPCHATYP